MSDKVPESATDGMSRSGRGFFDFVRVLARRGDTADDIVEYTTRVFTSTWPLRKRLAFAWKIIRKP